VGNALGGVEMESRSGSVDGKKGCRVGSKVGACRVKVQRVEG
jgi:hypothetical protein